MLRTYAEDLQSDAFNPEEYVERLAWRLTGSTSGCSVDACYLAIAMEEEVSNLQILFDQCAAKVEGLENQRREEEESYYASLEKLLAANEAALAKVSVLSEKVSSVSARIVHLGDQLQSVTGPRAKAYEAFKLMMHFNEFLSDQPLESDTFTDPDKLVEAGDVIQKLHIIASELPVEKYEAVQSRIGYKYDEVEKMLIEEFVRYHHANAKNKMKQIAHVLSQFKGYGQCVDAFIDQCQWQTYRSDDMFNEIWLLLKKNDVIISSVFPNPQQVMSKLVLSVFRGKLQVYFFIKVSKFCSLSFVVYVRSISLPFAGSLRAAILNVGPGAPKGVLESLRGATEGEVCRGGPQRLIEGAQDFGKEFCKYVLSDGVYGLIPLEVKIV
uniref:Exocyst complex component 5 n=1 Tax=Trichuris muris TaxID=70415 RepID=A0A5S6Q565_TRIMR